MKKQPRIRQLMILKELRTNLPSYRHPMCSSLDLKVRIEDTLRLHSLYRIFFSAIKKKYKSTIIQSSSYHLQTSEEATTDQATDEIEEIKNTSSMISLSDVFESQFKG